MAGATGMNTPRRRWRCSPARAIPSLLVLAVICRASATNGAAEEPPKGKPASAEASPAPEFNRDVAPVFKKYCLGCHNADDAEHGLVLETYEGLLKGGEGGAVIAAGKSDSSRLVLMLDGRAKPAMPPKDNEAPTPAEIALVRRWVDAGAKGPNGAGPDPTLLVTPKVKLLARPRETISAVAISPDGKLAALGGYAQVRLIDSQSRATLRTLSGHRGNVTAVEFSADGARIVSAAGEPGVFGEVKLWNTADGALVRTIVGHRDNLYDATLSRDGKLLATAGYDQQIKLWNAETGRELRTLAGHNGAVFDLAFSPDGKLLASASADRSVKLWDVASGTRLDTFGQPLKEVYAVAFSPDGRHVVAGGVDNRIRVWEISPSAKEGSNPLRYTRFAHEGAIVRLAFSPDGKTLVSSAEDRTVKIWNAADYTERRSLKSQPDWPVALALGADNSSLLVGRLDGSFAFYDTASGKPIPPPKPELTAVEPRGVQRGATAKIRLSGKYLVSASEVRTNSPKLAAKIIAGDGSQADDVWAEVTPAADLARGAYKVAVVTPGGASGEVTLHVDDLPQLAELEPNPSPAGQKPVPLPACVWGTLTDRGDVDHFVFDAKAGQTIVAELAAKTLGSRLNGVLTLLGPHGEVLATNNDYNGEADPLLAYQILADGRYAVRVGDLALNGSKDHFYRLAMGPLPYVTGCFPLSVSAGREGSVELTGFNLPAGARAKIAAQNAAEIDLPLDADRYRSRPNLKLLVVDGDESVEAEPNDAPAQATVLAVPGVIGGRIWARDPDKAGDVDLFRFEARKGQMLIVEIDAARRGSPLDSKIEILDAAGKPVPRVLLQAVRDSYLEFRPIDSAQGGARVKSWEEMELNQFVYLQGEVCKIFRMPQGPDSEMQFYQINGKRRDYFDTSGTAHALDDAVYIVEPHAPGETLLSTGLPVFPLNYANDDDAERKLGRDSRLSFTAPADGAYLVRVTDVRGYQGDRFAYRLTVRPAKPDFHVRLSDSTAAVPAGSGKRLTFSATRDDGFDGEITIDVTGLPPGFRVSTPVVIEAGQLEARAVLTAAADAPRPTAENRSLTKITAKARIDGQLISKDIKGLEEIKLEEKPTLLVRLEPAELVIAPGTTITAQLKVDRNGFKDSIKFDVDNLPHGVIVDNIGLNGVLIPAGETERQIFLTAAKHVPETSRPIHAVAEAAGTQASPAITLHVRAASVVADAGQKKK
jgi:WD40 repeat protein